MNTNSYKKIIPNVLSILCPLIISFSFVLFKSEYLSFRVEWCIIFASVLLSVLSIVLSKSKYQKTYKILMVTNVLTAILILMYSWLYYENLVYLFSSVKNFKQFILNTGNKGVVIYIVLQMLQVIFLPIPAAVICLAGAIIYGPLLGAIYCSLGIILGSLLSYFIGKVFGFRLVSWIAGKDNALKYGAILSKRGSTFLPIAFLLPLFPDDILCLIAGITTMRFSYFAFVVCLFRPIGVFCMSYFGGGYVIPFSGWGLYVWGVIIAIMIVFVYFSTKYQPKIEEWVITRFNIKKKNHK